MHHCINAPIWHRRVCHVYHGCGCQAATQDILCHAPQGGRRWTCHGQGWEGRLCGLTDI